MTNGHFSASYGNNTFPTNQWKLGRLELHLEHSACVSSDLKSLIEKFTKRSTKQFLFNALTVILKRTIGKCGKNHTVGGIS